MEVKGWKYYNHAVLPTTLPHEMVNLQPIQDGTVWKIEGGRRTPLMARWTSDFDCGCETNWWWIIKDTPFDVNELKAKRRYEIQKGKNFFDVLVIDPKLYIEDLFQVQMAAFSAYPKKYRPSVNKENFIKETEEKWNGKIVYGAFDRENSILKGYALLTAHDSCVFFNVLKTDPEEERRAINAAIVNQIVEDFNSRLSRDFYIIDGERSISHETAFQDYLEKYFGFRKAYCKFNIKYRPEVRIMVKILYPFLSVLNRVDNNRLIHNIISVLRMEEVVRESNK